MMIPIELNFAWISINSTHGQNSRPNSRIKEKDHTTTYDEEVYTLFFCLSHFYDLDLIFTF